jgi:hypothetical protein
MVFNATFNNISVISCCQFIWWWKLEYLEKTTDLQQVNDKLYHIFLYRVHSVWVGFKLTTLVAIDTDCIGSCKSNYYTITATTDSHTLIISAGNRYVDIWFGVNKMLFSGITFIRYTPHKVTRLESHII